jgi:HEPN domain-containing protein
VPEMRPVPGSPQEWIARAKGDLALAQAPLPEGGFYEDLCFHAQQAAEKALKSVYLHFAWDFRYKVTNADELVWNKRTRECKRVSHRGSYRPYRADT